MTRSSKPESLSDEVRRKISLAAEEGKLVPAIQQAYRNGELDEQDLEDALEWALEIEDEAGDHHGFTPVSREETA